MIIFLADTHFGSRSGALFYEALKDRCPMAFYENDLTPLADPAFTEACDLLILNLIAGTGAQPLAGLESELHLRAYLEQGKPLLLLHGASAAFWHWDWWRRIVGFRWVRENDPDGTPKSTHPIRPYQVDVSKCRHPLCAHLQPMDLGEDEIYTRLEQTAPATILMETTIEEGTFPQCWENTTPWGGRVIGFLPGHRKETFQNAQLLSNVALLISSLLNER